MLLEGFCETCFVAFQWVFLFCPLVAGSRVARKWESYMMVGVRTWAFWRRCHGAHFAWSLGRPALCFIRCAARTWRFGACASWYQGKVLGEFGYRCALRGEAGLTDPLQMSGNYESAWTHQVRNIPLAQLSWLMHDQPKRAVPESVRAVHTHIQIRNAKSTW